MKKRLFWVLPCMVLVSHQSVAENFPATLPDETNRDLTSHLIEESQYTSAVAENAETQSNHSISLEDLEKDFALFHQVFNQAVEQNLELTEALLPSYEKNPQHDPLLVLYAQSKIALKQNDTGAAVNYLRQIVDEKPDLTPSRFHLARALFADGQMDKAEEEFQRIKADKNLPEPVVQIVDQYLNEMAKQEKWHFDANLYYISDNNVNNSANLPPEKVANCGFMVDCTITYPQAEKAHGVGFGLSGRKDTHIKGRYYWRVGANTYGKHYWDNKKYNDITANVSTGLVYRSAQRETVLESYFARRIYGNNGYSKTYGVGVNNSVAMGNRNVLFTALDLSHKEHDQYQYLNGNDYAVSNTWLHRTSPKQYFTIGFDLGKSGAKDKSEAYQYATIRGSWEMDWQWQIKSNFSLGLIRRNYQDINFFGNKRHDNVYYSKLTLYKKDWHIAGITPRVVASYYKNKSNQKFYSYKKHQIFLDLIKTF